MNQHVIRNLFLLFLTLGAVFSAFAQTAQFSGSVTDPHQAMVQGAHVRIVNQATGVSSEVATNAEGLYVVPFVSPGTYQLFVKAQGFSTAMSEPLTVTVGQEMVFDVQLKVGSVEQTVTVNGGTQMMNTTGGSVSTVVDQQFVEDIPLNGRSFQDLISMTPGVVTQPPTGGAVGIKGDFSVNGQRAESNNYIVDGVSGNVSAGNGYGGIQPSYSGALAAQTVLGTSQSLVSVDALQEFRAENSSYSAEYGRFPGGQFTLVTRSGTNSVHGSAYDYLRNNFFDANDWFNDRAGVPLSALRQNDFGGTASGPVRIPMLYNGKDKTFFFVSYEGLRLELPQAAGSSYVPSLNLRQNAATAIQPLLNAFPLPIGAEIQIPCSGTTYSSTTMYPCPSGDPQGTSVPSGLSPFVKAFSLPTHVNSTSVRLDHNLSSKMKAFIRWGYTPSVSDGRTMAALTASHFNTQTYTAGVDNQISSNINNSFRLGYARSSTYNICSVDSFGGATPVNLATVLGTDAYPATYTEWWDTVNGVGSTWIYCGPLSAGSRQWNPVDTISISSGHHQLKFGVDYRHIDSPKGSDDPLIEASFAGRQQVLTNQSTYVYVGDYLASEPAFKEFSLFAQDEWRIASRVSLSLGLRWDVDPPPTPASGLDAYTLSGSIADPSSLALAPRGTALWKTSYLNFSPRLGVAWQARTNPGWETVVHAGGGVFFDTDDEDAAWGYGGLGYGATATYNNASFPLTAAMINLNPSSVTAPYTNSSVVAFPSHLQLPYSLEYNVSVQQALGKAQALTVSYVGSKGRRLLALQELNVNAFNSNFRNVDYLKGGITSDYDALQLQFQRQVSHGLQALASYTWSHFIDFGSSSTALSVKRGNSDFDVRHNLEAGLSWNLPNVNGNPTVRQSLSHWGLDGRFFARTGFPVAINGSQLTDPSTGNIFSSGVNLIAGVPIYQSGNYPGGRRVNSSAFQAVTGISTGNAPRNFVRGFGEDQINLAARREFPLIEGLKLQFRAETFNILNHPNFGAIDSSITDAKFGQATSMLNNSLGQVSGKYQQGGPRSMQFALKLMF